MAKNHQWNHQWKISRATRRLKSEYLELKKNPIPYTRAEPDNENALVWYFCIKGPKGTDYEGGYYYGELRFPQDYPFKPPSTIMNTPSGRFLPGTRICLSMNDHHPENWGPWWTPGSILNGLFSFMLEEYSSSYPVTQTGSIADTSQNRKELARKSGCYNLEKFPKFIEHFPDLVADILPMVAEIFKERLSQESESRTRKSDSEIS